MLDEVQACVLQAVYTALKETEQRSTDVVPLWKLPLVGALIPRQRKAQAAVALIRQTTEELIAKCKAMVDAEEQVRPPAALLDEGSQCSLSAPPSRVTLDGYPNDAAWPLRPLIHACHGFGSDQNPGCFYMLFWRSKPTALMAAMCPDNCCSHAALISSP